MVSQAPTRYFERRVPAPPDPLVAVARLASSGLYEDFVVYESRGQWSFAGDALFEVTLDSSGARLRQPARTTVLPWAGTPLRLVQSLLDGIPIDGWRAYGWAAFELAYAKDGDLGHVGDRRLLHLVVPRTEVRLRPGSAVVRSADPSMLSLVDSVLSGDQMVVAAEASPVEVRREGAANYRRAVEVAVGEINTGRYQKVILSRVVPLEHEIDFVATYLAGRRGNSPARSFLLRLDGIEAAGFSPEIVVEVTGTGRVVSQPLAGTRILTGDAAENARLRGELLADPKEIYEHAISVKAAYDELRGVCVPESLTVEELMDVKERGSVQHLASRVAGRLAHGRRAWDAFGAVFPAVTASGVPKSEAYTSIRANERKERGLYSGSVLTVDKGGAMDAALVLRAVYRENGMAWLQAGAGIVGQSRPEREFEETCEKLDSVARFLVPSRRAAAEYDLATSRSYFG